MKSLLLIAFRNVTLNWRHSLASLLSIAAAFFSLNVFQGYIHDLGDLYYVSYRHRSMFGDLMIENQAAGTPKAHSEPWKYGMSREVQNEVTKFVEKLGARATVATRFLDVQGTVTNGRVSTIFFTHGYDVLQGKTTRGELWKWNALYGEPLDLHPEGGRVILGQTLGRMLDCVPDPPVRAVAADGGYKPEVRPFKCKSDSVQISVTTDSGQLNAMDFQVGGLMDAGYLDIDKKFLWMSLPDAQTLLNTDRITYETILLSDPDDYPNVIKEFNQDLGARYPELRIMRWQDNERAGDLYNKTMSLLHIFRNFVVIVIISISTLSVLNTMTKSLSERIREIGTLLSIGFRKVHIRIIFISESIFLGALGIILGFLASAASAALVNHIGFFYKAGLLSEPVPFRIKLSLELTCISAFGLISLAALATTWACQRVLKKRIVECLQHA
jgi:putative ABC transport system permease protein